jgi:hypothetical protein
MMMSLTIMMNIPTHKTSYRSSKAKKYVKEMNKFYKRHNRVPSSKEFQPIDDENSLLQHMCSDVIAASEDEKWP